MREIHLYYSTNSSFLVIIDSYISQPKYIMLPAANVGTAQFCNETELIRRYYSAVNVSSFRKILYVFKNVVTCALLTLLFFLTLYIRQTYSSLISNVLLLCNSSRQVYCLI